MTPRKDMHELMSIAETMRRRSKEIIDGKKAALQKGGDALLNEVGEGKDLMSICRE